MIAISELRELLGPIADGRSDADLEVFRMQMSGFAQALVRQSIAQQVEARRIPSISEIRRRFRQQQGGKATGERGLVGQERQAG